MNSFFSQHPQRPEGEQAADLGEAVFVGEVIVHGVHPVQGSVVVEHAITVLSPGDITDENNRSPQHALPGNPWEISRTTRSIP